MVNLETHRVLDLLPDRTADSVAAWLRQHPEVEIVSRDRGGAYAEGARAGAPQAMQVADRFHLLQNLSTTVERILVSKQRLLRQAAQAAPDDVQPEPVPLSPSVPTVLPPCPLPRVPPPLTRTAPQQARTRMDRAARYIEVIALSEQGVSLSAIARRLGLSRPTVRTYVHADQCPTQVSRPSVLTPYEPYLWERWTPGCQNAFLLW